MSTAAANSSVMTSEGVAGEIANPASILCSLMVLMTSMCLSGSTTFNLLGQQGCDLAGQRERGMFRRTGSFVMESVEFTTCFGNGRDPLFDRSQDPLTPTKHIID